MAEDLWQRILWLEEELQEDYDREEDTDSGEDWEEDWEEDLIPTSESFTADFTRTVYEDEDYPQYDAQPPVKRKGIKGLVFLAFLEILGILAIIGWWLQWLI